MEGGEEEEEPKWEQRINAMTHILTSPTTSPQLHSQLFIATQIPCYLNWEYPPILCDKSSSSFPSLHWRWAFSVYLKRVFNRCPPRSSWRSKCPYHQPPPLVLAKGLEEARWDEEYRLKLFRKRLSRKPLVNKLNPLIPILLPNIIVLSVLLWDIPLPERY